MEIKFTKKGVKTIPASPGVYLFKKDNLIIYIGKAVSLKARVNSHLQNAKLDRKESLITALSNKIEYYLTDSEFKALLLESSLIQKFQPKYNLRWKDGKSYLYIKITVKEEFPKVFTVRRENDGKSLYFGPYPAQKDAEIILKTIRKLFPFCQQSRLTKRKCFYAKIGLCDPCPGEIANLVDYADKTRLKKIYRKNIRQVIGILQGNLELVLKDSYKLLKTLAKKQKFEDALSLRNKIIFFKKLISQTRFNPDYTLGPNNSDQTMVKLRQILSVYFPGLKSLHRIECYDVSNLFQK